MQPLHDAGDRLDQRCWVRNTANILNQPSKSGQPKAKAALAEIDNAATRKERVAA